MGSSRRRKPVDFEAEDIVPVRLVNDLKVIEDADVLSPLPHGGAFKGLRFLTLEDGTRCIGCAECDFAGEPVTSDLPPSRGPVLRHRMEQHGAGRSGARRSRADTSPVIDEIQFMTVYELLEAARQAHQLSQLVDTLIDQRDEARAELDTMTRQQRKLVTALSRVGFVPKLEELEEEDE